MVMCCKQENLQAWSYRHMIEQCRPSASSLSGATLALKLGEDQCPCPKLKIQRNEQWLLYMHWDPWFWGSLTCNTQTHNSTSRTSAQMIAQRLLCHSAYVYLSLGDLRSRKAGCRWTWPADQHAGTRIWWKRGTRRKSRLKCVARCKWVEASLRDRWALCVPWPGIKHTNGDKLQFMEGQMRQANLRTGQGCTNGLTTGCCCGLKKNGSVSN